MPFANPIRRLAYHLMTSSREKNEEELHDEALELRIQSGLLLAGGTILENLENLAMNNHELKSIGIALKNAVSVFDILFLFLLSFLLIPVARFLVFPIFGLIVSWTWDRSWLRFITTTVAQAARLGLVVYAVDCLVIVLSIGMDFDPERLRALALGFTKILYISWAAYRLTVIKNNVFSGAINKAPQRLGRLYMVNKMIDMVIYTLTGLMLLDVLNVEMGASGLTSIFALGSLSTLMVGLATKDLAEMFVSGLTMSTSDRFNVGDAVEFGDSTAGVVEDIGWMQTKIRKYDETVVVIPNGQLGMQRVHNLSRIKKCRVRQELRFRYEDAANLPNLLPDILEEIRYVCPEAILDGSRPWRAVWTGYEDYYLPVTVDVHFDLPPIGSKYLENRQRVVEAIYRAVQKHKMKFASPLAFETVKGESSSNNNNNNNNIGDQFSNPAVVRRMSKQFNK
mmetsp:Transcript_32756/g.49369  ORF Transcript_32756/g.49369 Transcript_32756/m.49369 type:complete len:452 (+) Transcript_32756:44-1399(+)